MLKVYSELIGQTLSNVENVDNEELVMTLANGEKYRFYHSQNCCESVEINDIIGDLSDLIGSPILMAEEYTSENSTPDGAIEPKYHDESYTWTFYKFATAKGYVTIRWYGSSNGYYSESVDFSVCR